jgi:uncharacterized protein YyaL (SSP411 family)
MQLSRRVVLRALGLLVFLLLALVWWYGPTGSVDRVARPTERLVKVAPDQRALDARAAASRAERPAVPPPEPELPAPNGADRAVDRRRPGATQNTDSAHREQAADRDGTPNRPPPAGNRLAGETSPYLLMHAHNPVDWYPWCAEAFTRAREENKLVFLSIGYSSCHWCHVMERETFRDDAIAALLNEHFVCIKVDREERPDVDEIYMTALQVFLQLIHSDQGGGWPLSMFLTPNGDPVMGGTYFPPRATQGRPGFEEMLQRVVALWQQQPEQVRSQGRQLADAVRQNMLPRRSAEPARIDRQVVDDLMTQLERRYDSVYGGFGFSEVDPRMPKFPEPSTLAFLLHRAADRHDLRAREMALATLDKMARGGIQDQVGGGFHRYSTDRFWRVPHFEKMLYDNAQLASVYADAYALTSRRNFRRVAQRLADFVLRDMTAPDGGFYASIDADSDGQEGAYYTWSLEELKAALTETQMGLATDLFGLDGEPNLEDRYVLQIATPLAEIARRRSLPEADLTEQMDALLTHLREVRQQRPRPRTDTKILTAWNGLMIRGMADVGSILGDDRYITAATRAADFVLTRLRDTDGRLLRSYRDGQAKLSGYLEDYAMLVNALIALDRVTGEKKWRDAAEELTDMQIELFWDDQGGGFFFTATDHDSLLVRSKRMTDSGLPSGNAVSVDNLIYLTHLFGPSDYLPYAERTIQAADPLLQQMPTSMPRMGMAVANYLRLREETETLPTDGDGPRNGS